MKNLTINKNEVDLNKIITSDFKIIFSSEDKLILIDKDSIEHCFYLNSSNNELSYNGKLYKYKKNVRSSKTGNDDHEMISPMPGKIIKIFVSKDEKVSKGQTLLIMEAMKMEHAIKAPFDGIVESIFFTENQQVEAEVELIKLK